MRKKLMLIALAFVVLFVGFIPNPLIKPDWKTPFKEAWAKEDCEGLERVVDLLTVTGYEGAQIEAILDLMKADRCRYVDSSEKVFRAIENLYEADVARQNFFVEYVNIGWRTSYIGRQIQFYFNQTTHSKDRNFRRAQRRLDLINAECQDKFSPFFGGAPNYKLLSYALSHPELSVDDIDDISLEQQTLCTVEWLQIGRLFLASARSEDDYIKAADQLSFVSMYALRFAPELEPAIRAAQAEFPQSFKEAHSYFFSEPYETEEFFECKDNYVAKAGLAAAMNCTSRAAQNFDIVSIRPVFAIYYARRAKRLGWRDVEAIETAARQRVSAECAEAIIELEESDAGDIADPRRFIWNGLPVGAGEGCEEEAGNVQSD